MLYPLFLRNISVMLSALTYAVQCAMEPKGNTRDATKRAKSRHALPIRCHFNIDMPLFGEFFAASGRVSRIIEKSWIKHRSLSNIQQGPMFYPVFFHYSSLSCSFSGVIILSSDSGNF